MRRFRREAFRFLVVGGINFFLTLILYLGMLRIVKIHYLIALIVSWAIGMMFTYVLNFLWVFKPDEKIEFRNRFPKYFTSQLVSIGLNTLALQMIVVNFGMDPFWGQFLLIPMVVVFNFSAAKFWALKRQ